MKPDHRRILIADDLPSIHEDYRKILAPTSVPRPLFSGVAGFPPLFADSAESTIGFDLECVLQGEAAIVAAANARAAGQPFAIAFVDVRMPPGIDGVETACRLRAADPDLQIVLCTAYSDYSLGDIARRFPESDGLLILKKPFDPVEVQQLARSLCRKWRLAAEHRALLADLEARVAARTTELHDAKAELEVALRSAQAASRAKSEFLANMSHEIRTPLNAVLGMAELLQSTPLDENQREFTDTIRTSGDALLTIINEILDFSKIEHGSIELEVAPFDLRRCLAEALEIAVPPKTDRSIRLSHEVADDIPSLLLGDAFRLRQILVNLVANAFKFTERGEITVTARRIPAPFAGLTDRLLLTVRDTGIGIPADRRDRLFQAFSQIDASITRRYGGTGLGLAITHRLVTLLGGCVHVDSNPGAGSEFRVELPLRPAHEEPAVPSAPSSSPDGYALDPSFSARFPLRILLVEDNPVNQRVAYLLLQKLGYAPTFAVNGAEALEAVAREAYDAILLDVQMPVMDGLECARRLRSALPDSTRPWVIAMTANALEGDREICLASGMDDYTSKPMRVPVIAEALSRGHACLAARRGTAATPAPNTALS
jgi:two-component system, sensor histidine kinase and response regulator